MGTIIFSFVYINKDKPCCSNEQKTNFYHLHILDYIYQM